MNSQLFFLLNLVIGALFLIWFLSGRKGRGGGPTQLNLKRGNDFSESTPAVTTPVATDMHMSVSSGPTDAETSPKIESVDHRVRNAKSLNVIFIYNGHSWDAYEVLGVPAGANISLITAHYQKLIKTADQGQLEFYELAYQAILKKI